jgi:hypothetical protein
MISSSAVASCSVDAASTTVLGSRICSSFFQQFLAFRSFSTAEASFAHSVSEIPRPALVVSLFRQSL